MSLAPGPSDPPATDMAAELAAGEARFEAKYGELRRVLRRSWRGRHLTRLADRLGGRLEDLLLGARLREPLDRPLFVTGSYRSGTTLVERALALHPSLATFDYLSFAFPSAPFLAGLVRRVAGPGAALACPDQPNLRHDSATPTECEMVWRFSTAHLWSARESHVLGPEHAEPAFERLLLATIHKHLRRARRPRFFNKNPLCTLRVGYLARLFPDARFVHVVRHPWRVVRSQLDLERMWARVLSRPRRDWGRALADPFMPPGRVFPRTPRWKEIEAVRGRDPALAVALSVADFQRAFDEAVLAGRLEERVLRVRHEDLLADFAAELGRILRHAELEGAEAVAAQAERALVDRTLCSQSAPLPRFSPAAEAVLGELAELTGYRPPADGDAAAAGR